MKILIAITAATILLALCGAAVLGFALPLRDLAGLGLATAGILAAMIYTRHQKFTAALGGLLIIVWFTSAFVILTYEAAGINRPLVDAALAAADKMLGTEIVRGWGNTSLGSMFSFCYDTVLLQTAGVVCLFNRKRLNALTLRMMIGGFVVLACFILWPARGPFVVPTASQQLFLDHLFQLRAGQPFLTFSNAQGLITFPSFHAVWALLLTDAYRHWSLTILNGIVLVSTLTTGWHYGIDLIAGIGLALLLMKVNP